MREHAPGNGERYARVEGARADTPTTIGQYHDLVSNLYLLASCLARRDNAQHVAILQFDILSSRHIEQAGQRFARGYFDAPYIDRLFAAKAQVNQKLDICHEVGWD